MSKLLEQINSKSKIGSIKDLVFPVSNTFNFTGKEKVVFINTGDVFEGKFLHNNYSPVNKLPGQAKKVIEPGDILFSEIRPKNRHFALVDFDSKDYVVSTKLIVLKVKESVDQKYAYIVLTADQNLREFQNIAESRSGTFPQITFESIADYEVNIPDTSIQKKIASILSAYDEKIENNNKIIKNLEQMAQTIFNEWFVNFKFPGYEKVKMINSEMGEIPEGWEIKPLDEVADFLNGVASQKYPAEDLKNSLPVIKIREMNSGIDKNSDRATKNIDSKYIIKNGDILFAWSGSLSLMVWVGDKGVLNQHIFKVTSETYPEWFIYMWTKRHLQNFIAIADGKATTMGHIQRRHLSESSVLLPDQLVFKKMDKILNKIFKQQISLQIENLNLKESRDQLLAKLI